MRKLNILWTNGNEITSEHMVLLYATNSIKNSWWDEVNVIIWGDPQLLIAKNETFRNKVIESRNLGVKFSACETCAKNLDTYDFLKKNNFDIRRWGKLLTNIIDSDEKLITV